MEFFDFFALFVVYPYIGFQSGRMLYRGFMVEWEKASSESVEWCRKLVRFALCLLLLIGWSLMYFALFLLVLTHSQLWVFGIYER